jgi:dihydroxyacetone kinase
LLISLFDNQMTTASNIIEEMLNRMTDSDSSCSFPLPSGCSVALIVNNLGGLSIMEMSIAAREAIKQLGNISYFIRI